MRSREASRNPRTRIRNSGSSIAVKFAEDNMDVPKNYDGTRGTCMSKPISVSSVTSNGPAHGILKPTSWRCTEINSPRSRTKNFAICEVGVKQSISSRNARPQHPLRVRAYFRVCTFSHSSLYHKFVTSIRSFTKSEPPDPLQGLDVSKRQKKNGSEFDFHVS